MNGDFTLDSFDPRKRFSRVMMQQGRVQLDADWNEQTSLTLGYVRTLARDMLGPGAGPESDVGFKIVTKADVKAPAGGADPFKEFRAEITSNKNALNDGDLLLLPGRYYVGGLPAELDAPLLYGKQHGFEDSAAVAALNEQDMTWIAYLDVWEQFVSAEQDPDIREPALGGVDTCGRALIRWQVRVLVNPENGLHSLEQLAKERSAMLAAWTKEGETPDKDKACIIAPDAKYRGLENQLYRVEIHHGSHSGADGQEATFKWSRDNGALHYGVKDIHDHLVVLDHLGRDERTGLAAGDWVELVDDYWAGRDPPGPLAQVKEVKRDQRAVLLDWAQPSPDLPLRTVLEQGLRPVLRRWDHRGDYGVSGGAIPIAGTGEIELEDGIFIRFALDGRYRAGDHWLIPARVLTAGILWPGGPKTPESQPPHGPEHFYAPLALFDKGSFKDLRCKFGPISVPV